jgi:uncharacterized membrane protein YebE (DUF533 family)
MSSLAELKASILEDGVIDADEVATLRTQLYDDGVIDREEANFLFELNDATSGKDNDPGWRELFVEAITDHLLTDETSPGALDDDEAEWLITRLEGDGQIDENEQALINALKVKSTSLSAKFTAKFG